MRLLYLLVILVSSLPSPAAEPIPGEVSCDRGVDIARVQALVRKTVAALQKDQDAVLRQINQGSSQWKDGSLYTYVFKGTTVLAHGLLPSLVGQDVGTTTYQNAFPCVRSGLRIATEKGEGCFAFRFHNPAKNGQVEEKIAYVMKVSDSIWAGSGTYQVRK